MANPNPSPSTRFGAENGNPIAGGKTSEQKKAEYEAAEKAAKLRLRLLSIIEETTADDDNALLAMLDANTLKLFKDSEDRAHGTPKQQAEITGENGGALAMALTVKTMIVDGDQ